MRTLCAILAMVLVVGCSKPVDVAGSWKGAYNVTVSPSPFQVKLTQSGSKLTGSYSAIDLAGREAFEGTLEGTVDGEAVAFIMKVPQESRDRMKWSDYQFKGVLKVEDGETVLSGWTTRQQNGQKDVMETLLTRETKH